MTRPSDPPVVLVADTMVLPSGMDPDDHVQDVDTWAVHVLWEGTLGWIVTGRNRDERLTVRSRSWTRHVSRRNRRFYYFGTYEEALDAATDVVDARTVNGRTWAQWQVELASRTGGAC